MFSPEKIVTQGDRALSLLLSEKDLSWHGYILRVVTRACMRTAPFANVNVVATAAFLSTVGIDSFCRGSKKISYDVFAIFHDLANDRMTRLELARACREVQKSLGLSRDFSDAVLRYFGANARTLMAFIDAVPGDVVPEPSAPPAAAGEHRAVQLSTA